MRLACALGLLLTAAAQDRPDLVIRTTTRLVQVRLMAADSKGDPVTDLRKDELQLQDNRKAQPIAFLVAEGGASSGGSASGAASSTPEAVRDDYAVIMLDWLNPRYADRIRVRDQVNKLLGNFHPRQQVALYILGHESRLLHDFTSDPHQLLETLAATPEDPEDPFDPSKPASSNDPRYKTWATLTMEERIARFNVKIVDTMEALGKVADGLGRIPGRKSLIWVTNGFPISLDGHAVPGAKPEEINYREYVEPLIGRVNRANVAIYTVDARGLPMGAYGDMETMGEFSARTGGSTFAGRNDLDEGIRLALDDTKISYTLGFTLPANAPLGLHEIRLRTTRPGVVLRYRESYALDR